MPSILVMTLRKTIPFILIMAAFPQPGIAALSNQIVEDGTFAGCPPDYPFKDDNLRMVIRDGKNMVHQLDFCSSYGRADAKIENDAKGNRYVILRYGEGRGTNARNEYLRIYKIGRKLFEFIRIPLSGPAGPASRWEYTWKMEKPKAGGLTFKLQLNLEGESPENIPAEKIRVISIK